MEHWIERLAPVRKASSEPVVIDGLEAAESLSSKAMCILNSVSGGKCPADIGATLIQSIGSVAKIFEIDELDRRLAALEADRVLFKVGLLITQCNGIHAETWLSLR